MAYAQDAFPFPMENPPQANMYFHPTIQYTPYLQQPPQYADMMMFPHHLYSDYGEFMSMGMMPEDFDENSEVSTRPRLTKEQVEVLESQFQAHPKPNSMVKKQLAVQTKLTLPRVANWFQNRRAKAKQQRKQEEFEFSQNLGATADWKGQGDLGSAEKPSKPSSPAKMAGSHKEISDSTDPRSPSTSDSANETGWARLQRTFSTKEAASQQRLQYRGQEQDQVVVPMPPPTRPQYHGVSSKSSKSPSRAPTASLSPSSDWARAQSIDNLTSPSTIAVPTSVQDLGFDFGFDQDHSSTSHGHVTDDSPETGSQQYVVSPVSWGTSLPAQASSASQHSGFTSTTDTSPVPLPAYSGSRRGSGSDELITNLGTFALAGTPPVSVLSLDRMGGDIRPTEKEIDIASRRKRPRPAALPLSSLRSRSYGQLSSTSPAFRPGPPNGNVLRHVKSTGHSLNTHYAGVRKASLPQKSPLNLASFTEAEALRNIMAQQATAVASNTNPLITPIRTEVGQSSFSQEMANRLGLVEDHNSMGLPQEILTRLQNLQSPPHTPFQPDYMMQPSSASMPPPSARSQYASFVDYTPPYSAGPLTNSTCWSDAPLQSPDVTGYPSGHFMSSLSFTHQQDPSIQPWILPSDGGNDLGLNNMGISDENRRTEFLITEFPGQKEEYASIAQHILQPKPKNYVFANTAPSDYDG